MALILHIETATKVCSVALSKEGHLVDHIDLLGDGFAHGEQLTLLIEQLCNNNQVQMNHLDAVSISAGPGSYTGLRIGTSTAKGICFALKIPLISVDTLFAMAEIAWEIYPGQKLLPMIDARRMEVFSCLYDADKSVLRSMEAEIITEQGNSEFEPFVYFGDGAEKVQEVWKTRNLTCDLSIHPSARGQVRIAFEKFSRNEFEDVAYFEPNYLKEFYMAPPKAMS